MRSHRYHLACIGLTLEAANKKKSYECKACKTTRKAAAANKAARMAHANEHPIAPMAMPEHFGSSVLDGGAIQPARMSCASVPVATFAAPAAAPAFVSGIDARVAESSCNSLGSSFRSSWA